MQYLLVCKIFLFVEVNTFNKELSYGLLLSNDTHISSIIWQRTVVDGEETFVAYTLEDVPVRKQEIIQ